MTPKRPVVGVDVGATKIAAGTVTGTRIRNLTVRATPHETKKALVDAIAEAVATATPGVAPSAVGIGMPYGIRNLPHSGPALLPDLKKKLGGPVRLENDANCAAVGEARARRARHLVMFTLGTGFGTGVVIDGALFRGADGLGSEFGNSTIDYDYEGPAASYNPGRLHDLVSGSGLVAEATATATAPEAEGYLAGLLKRQGSITALDVARAARSGDRTAVPVFERFAVRLGVGIANAVNTFQPRQLVLGGGLAEEADLYLDLAMQEAGRRAMQGPWEKATVSVSKLEQAGVVGAGALAAAP